MALTVSEALDLITNLLAKYRSIPASAISQDMTLQTDLGLDSLDATELIITLEENHGFVVDLDEIADLGAAPTVGALARVVSNASGDRSGVGS